MLIAFLKRRQKNKKGHLKLKSHREKTITTIIVHKALHRKLKPKQPFTKKKQNDIRCFGRVIIYCSTSGIYILLMVCAHSVISCSFCNEKGRNCGSDNWRISVVIDERYSIAANQLVMASGWRL